MYFGQSKLEPALDYVRKSLQKYDRSLLAWNLQGLILDSQEKYDDAIACYQQALKIIPGEPNVSFNLATSLLQERAGRQGQGAPGKDAGGAGQDPARNRAAGTTRSRPGSWTF